MSNTFQSLYQLLDLLSSQPECKSCRLCEENVGLVYALESEVQNLDKRQVLYSSSSENIHYLKRVQDNENANHWWCTCFDPTTNTCKIYEDRPLCCRIYPLDLMEFDREIWWVMHSECPIAKRFNSEHKLDILSQITRNLEEEITPEIYKSWVKQNLVSNSIEAFSFEETKIIKLRKYGRKSSFH